MLIKPVIRSIDTAEVRASSEGEDSPSLNEGLASTGIVFHRHQLKRMAAVPSPGALKDITNTGSAENEDYDNHEETLRVLRPEPKKIVGENSPDSMQSNSRIYEESESKDYSAFQQYLDIGRRSTTTSGPTGEDGLFMFEGQSCYEEVVICTIPFGVVVGAPRSSASLLSTFYIVKFSGEVAAPGFIEFGQAGILSTVKLADCLSPAIQCAFPIVEERTMRFVGILGLNKGNKKPSLNFLSMCPSFSIPPMLNVDGVVYPTERSEMGTIQMLPPWDDPRQASVSVFKVSSKEAMFCGAVRSCRKFSPLFGRLPSGFIPTQPERITFWAFIGSKMSSPDRNRRGGVSTLTAVESTATGFRESLAMSVRAVASITPMTGEITICDLVRDENTSPLDPNEATTVLLSGARYRLE